MDMTGFINDAKSLLASKGSNGHVSLGRRLGKEQFVVDRRMVYD
jgi:hypothetical protein